MKMISLRTSSVHSIRSQVQPARCLVSSLFQTAVQVSLQVDVSICGCLCTVSVLVACASGLDPLRPPRLDIPEKDS